MLESDGGPHFRRCLLSRLCAALASEKSLVLAGMCPVAKDAPVPADGGRWCDDRRIRPAVQLPRVRTTYRDIISDVMWEVELEPEVEEWLDKLTLKDFASVLSHIERLGERGNALRMPASRSLGDGLFELRFDLTRVAWRIPFFFAPGRRIVLLTVFRKQRMNERDEIERARIAMRRCIAEGHTAEED